MAALAAGAIPGLASDTAPGPPSALGKVEDPALPLTLPGFELRVLDRSKPVRFQVGDSQAEAELPIFIYYPTGDRGGALRRVRDAYDELQQLGRKPEWTAAELHRVLANLDDAMRLLSCNPSATTSN